MTIKNNNKVLYCSIFPKPHEEAKGDLIEVGKVVERAILSTRTFNDLIFGFFVISFLFSSLNQVEYTLIFLPNIAKKLGRF